MKKISVFTEGHICKPVLHGSEYVCGICGFVDQELTLDLQRKLTNEDERASTLDQNYPVSRLINNDRYYNDNSRGDIFEELGNPGAKDYMNKRVKRSVLLDGYQVMYTSSRRGEFRWNGKWRADYAMDKWVNDVSKIVIETCEQAGIDLETVSVIKGEIVKGYSKIILGPMIPLICALAFKAASIASMSKETRENIERSIPILLEQLNQEFDRMINAEVDEELESLLDQAKEIKVIA